MRSVACTSQHGSELVAVANLRGGLHNTVHHLVKAIRVLSIAANSLSCFQLSCPALLASHIDKKLLALAELRDLRIRADVCHCPGSFVFRCFERLQNTDIILRQVLSFRIQHAHGSDNLLRFNLELLQRNLEDHYAFRLKHTSGRSFLHTSRVGCNRMRRLWFARGIAKQFFQLFGSLGQLLLSRVPLNSRKYSVLNLMRWNRLPMESLHVLSLLLHWSSLS
mmetsp:Transcript_22682/g.90875  ORF Transcript_22682/g.90875 Transcript_22682/m.90875 type:complete len:222 (+) Transcript_22682:3532-4197(+)